MNKHVASFIARWRRRRSRKHLSRWDIPTFDPNSGDLTAVRDTLARMLERDHITGERFLP